MERKYVNFVPIRGGHLDLDRFYLPLITDFRGRILVKRKRHAQETGYKTRIRGG